MVQLAYKDITLGKFKFVPGDLSYNPRNEIVIIKRFSAIRYKGSVL